MGVLAEVARLRRRRDEWRSFWRVALPVWGAAAVVGAALVALVYLIRR